MVSIFLTMSFDKNEDVREAFLQCEKGYFIAQKTHFHDSKDTLRAHERTCPRSQNGPSGTLKASFTAKPTDGMAYG